MFNRPHAGEPVGSAPLRPAPAGFRPENPQPTARDCAAAHIPAKSARKKKKRRLTSASAGRKSLEMSPAQKQFSLNRAASKSKFLSVKIR